MPFEIPADLLALTDEALEEALAAALTEAAEFDKISDEDLTDEHLDQLSQLAEFVTAARAEKAARQDRASERTGKIAAARDAIKAEPAAAAGETIELEPEKVVDEPEPVTVAASGQSVVARAAAAGAGTTRDKVPTLAPRPAITASADVPGFPTGGALEDLDDLGKAMVARMHALPTQRIGGTKGVQNRYSVANIDLAQVRSGDLVQTGSGDDQGLLSKARDAGRLDGGALLAAGGWCAPSETLYDLCSAASTDGLLDLPTVNVTRGGIRFTRGGTFSDIYNNEDLGWWLTEAEVIAGGEKPCLEIECPDFEDVRLDAVGLCIRVPLLTEAAYPELIRWTIENALIAHQHVVDRELISRIVADSVELDVAGTFETTIDSIAKIEQAANWMRQQWRRSFGATMEVLAPYWYRTTVRADLARRTGVDLINVSDQTIQNYFTAAGVRIQWLYNYQPLANSGTANAPVVDTPDEVQLVIYPAGTWIKGTTDVIRLDAVYDSTSLAQNVYTALFTEEGVLVARPCWESYVITIPTCASGRTGAADLTSCVLGAGTTGP